MRLFVTLQVAVADHARMVGAVAGARRISPATRLHDLRHTCATLMLAVDTNPKVVQETLGHANVSVTLDTYSHLLPNMQDEVAEKINELLC